MRARRRIAVLLASTGALGVGLIAFPGSAAAAPPVVPACTFPNTTGSDSCATHRVNAITPPFGGALEPADVRFRVSSQFNPQGSEVSELELRFDEHIAIDLSDIPTCPASELVGRDWISQAWEQCGPGADGNPPSEGNAYLSMGIGPNVSGILDSTIDNWNFIGCVLIFKGANNAQLTIYANWVFGSTPSACDNPEELTGEPILLHTGTLRRDTAGPDNWVLTVPLLNSPPVPMGDLYATLRRADAFQAGCPAGTSPFSMRAEWDYTAPGDPTDFDWAPDPCP
jgi:hypothetical protein